MSEFIKIYPDKPSEAAIAKVVKVLQNGGLVIYPTDTVYGLGCNALNKKAVAKIKKLKGRDSKKPLSIIVPSKKWISEHCVVDKKLVSKYLPGKYTLIVKKKNKKFLNHVSESETIGIRIPKHSFVELIQKSGVPFITTSVNLSGEKPAINVDKIDKKIMNKVDVIIDDGIKNGKPSTIVLPDGKLLKR